MRQVVIGEGDRRRPAQGAPEAEVLLSEEGGVAVLGVTVPPGGRMPPHDHGASSVVLVPLSGKVGLSAEVGDGRIELGAGAIGAVGVGERVQIENVGDGEARLLVVLSPPDFVESVKAWPRVEQ